MTKNIKRKKYHRTYHLNWSEAVQSDDKVLSSLEHFEGEEIVVTEKLDGENTTLYQDYLHARSIDSQFNFTRAWVTNMHSQIKYSIPENIKLVGENLWAEHSIRYPDNHLEGYFYLFSVWVEEGDEDRCLSFDETCEYANFFDLPTPKVLYRGIYNEKILKDIANKIDTNLVEGYVVRKTKSYLRSESDKNLAKWVRKGHVQDNAEHWLKNAKQNGKLPNIVKPSFMGKIK